MSNSPTRIHFLDELRGFAVLLMICYFFLKILSLLSPTLQNLSLIDAVNPYRPILPVLFVSISGMAIQMSHHATKRGLLLTALAIAFTLLSLLLFPAAPIYFGMLHQLAFCILFCLVFHPLLGYIPPVAGFVVSLVIFILTYHVSDGYIGFQSLISLDITALQGDSVLLYPLGLLNTPLSAFDYYPIFPWFFLFLAFTFIGTYAAEGRFPEWTTKMHVRPLAFVGRHSLLIYVLHIPILYGLLWLLTTVGIL